jgi:uncharacterized repeat protein (TIGR03803 family)
MKKLISTPRTTFFLAAVATLLVTLFLSSPVFSQTETVLHHFQTDNMGTNPNALIFDTAGNLYGTATGNCIANGATCGVVFELTPNSRGWQYRVLYAFTGGSDGGSPYGGLVFDAAGNLYGTTYEGGVTNCIRGNVAYGCGVVFKLSPGSQGWTESVLYTFTGGSDGGSPISTLIFDAAGNLYGTTVYGGDTSAHACTNGNGSGCGVVFELSPTSSGGWTQSVIHSFAAGKDGFNPFAGLTSDAAGNLYGTTAYGGDPNACFGTGCGTVFKLVSANGTWTETVLYAFTGKNGAYPTDGLILDAQGDLFGNTTNGGGGAVNLCGVAGCGVAFELSPSSGAAWKETVLHRFGGIVGKYPQGNLVFDAAGNLYGTTLQDGAPGSCMGRGCGAVFELTPGTGGKWTAIPLHDFKHTDGANPGSGVIFGAGNTLYGTTAGGGKGGYGTVFQLTPAAAGQ